MAYLAENGKSVVRLFSIISCVIKKLADRVCAFAKVGGRRFDPLSPLYRASPKLSRALALQNYHAAGYVYRVKWKAARARGLVFEKYKICMAMICVGFFKFAMACRSD
jgi:hypothetical protein